MQACVGFDQSISSVFKVDFYRLLSRSLPQYLVADSVRPANLENPSKAVVDERLDSLHVLSDASEMDSSHHNRFSADGQNIRGCRGLLERREERSNKKSFV